MSVAQNNHTANAAVRGQASVRDSESVMRKSRSVTPERATSNQAMQRALRNGTIQAKLTVNTPNDEFEREADRVATSEAAVAGEVARAVDRAVKGGTGDA